ncbi:hypothetical protein ACFL96_11370 [Thermoproteota archaeon]
MDNDIIKSILSTYQLKPKLEAKLIRIAQTQIENRAITSFDEQYRYIDSLVSLYTGRYADKFDISLNKPIKNSDNLFLEIPVEDKGIQAIENFETTPCTEDTDDVLRQYLDDTEYELFKRLISNKRMAESVDPESLVTHISIIKENLQGLLEKYSKSGQIVLPHRPIVHVKLGPPLVLKFRRRNYQGNPLAYFREHIDIYKGLSRLDLETYDSGLYQQLKKYGQLDNAIPEILNKPLTPEQHAQVVQAYYDYEGNACKADQNLPFAQSTIISHWRKEDLEIRPMVRDSLPQEDIDRIIEAHSLYNGNCHKARDKIKISRPTIRKYWKQAGLIARGNYIDDEREQRIVDAHLTYGGNATKAGKALGHSPATILRWWRKNGLESSYPYPTRADKKS